MSEQKLKLGELLLRRNLIKDDQVEKALANQIIYGGRFGTNLIELGYIQLDYIGRSLSIQLGVPQANTDDFSLVEKEILELVSTDLVEKYQVFPLKRQAQILHLAMMQPKNEQHIVDLSAKLGFEIKPYIAPELRLLFFMEHKYGIARDKRFLRMAEDKDRVEPGRRTYLQPTVKSVNEGKFPEVGTAPDVLEDLDITIDVGSTEQEEELVYLDEFQKAQALLTKAVTSQEKKAPEASASVASEKPPLDSQDTRQGPGAILSIVKALDDAVTGGQVAELIVQPIFPNTVLSALFWVRGEMAVGCCAHNISMTIKEIQSMVISLNTPSLMQWAHTMSSPVRAPARTDPIQLKLTEFFRSQVGEEACVVPILFQQKVVNLLCIHSAEGTQFPSEVFAYLKILGEHAAKAYGRLMQRITNQ